MLSSVCQGSTTCLFRVKHFLDHKPALDATCVCHLQNIMAQISAAHHHQTLLRLVKTKQKLRFIIWMDGHEAVTGRRIYYRIENSDGTKTMEEKKKRGMHIMEKVFRLVAL